MQPNPFTDPNRTSPANRSSRDVSIVIPVYNEALNLSAQLDGLRVMLQSCCESFEIVVVNDGSTDGSPDILRARSDIRLLEHPTNRGYGAALKTGIRHAKYSIIIISDADGTYPVEHIAALLARIEHCDMVVGARIGNEVQYSWVRSIPKWFLVRFAEWMGRQRIPDLNSGLRVFHRDIALRFLKILPDGFSFTTTITLAMLTNAYLVEYEPINYRSRTGRSKIRPIRDTLGMLRTIFFTGMYFAPLRVFLPIAGLFFLGFVGTFSQDLYYRNLNERTLILFVAATQFGMFALLAEMIDKRSP